MKTRHNVVSWMGLWNRERTLGKTKETKVWTVINNDESILTY